MLKIRLQRIGKRGQAYFKVIVTEHTRKPKGKYLELLGSYDPHKNEMNVDAEKVKHWLSQGAKMSPTVNNLLVGRGVIKGEKVKVWKLKKKTTVVSGVEQASAPSQQAKIKETEVKEEKTDESATETPKEDVKEEKKEEVAPAVAEIPAVN